MTRELARALAGDLNDFDGDACCRDVAGSMPTSRVLRMLKDPHGSGSDALHSVAARLPLQAHPDPLHCHERRSLLASGGVSYLAMIPCKESVT